MRGFGVGGGPICREKFVIENRKAGRVAAAVVVEGVSGWGRSGDPEHDANEGFFDCFYAG